MTRRGADDLFALPLADRLRPIEDLWKSIEAEASDRFALPDWQRNEIDRRLAAPGDGTRVGASWAEVRRRLVATS